MLIDNAEAADRHAHLRTGRARAARQAVHEDHQPRAGGAVMQRVTEGDTVVVIAGKDKGTRGRVLRVLPGRRPCGRRGHQHRHQAHQAEPDEPAGRSRQARGTRSTLSNVMLADPKTGEPTRVRIYEPGRRPPRARRGQVGRADRQVGATVMARGTRRRRAPEEEEGSRASPSSSRTSEEEPVQAGRPATGRASAGALRDVGARQR